MAPVTASPAGRKSPVGKNRVLVTAAAEPVPETQAPNMGRLTAVLALCFAVGVAWPIAGGLELTQRPPGSSPPKAVEVEPEGTPDGEPSLVVSPLVPALHVAPLALANALPHVDKRIVQSCESDAGEVLGRCDAPNLDAVLEAPLAKLAACARARGVSGVLSLGMFVDFSRGHISRVKPGQSTTFTQEQTTRLLGCAEDSLVGATLDGVEHAHARYWIYHVLRFALPGAPGAGVAGEVVSASGQATVGFRTAIVRESPASQAPVAIHLGQGTRVSVTGRAGDWYRIEHSGKRLGWVHRDALGL